MYKTIVNNKLEQTYKKGTKHCKSSHLGNAHNCGSLVELSKNMILLHNLVKHAFCFFPASHFCVVKSFAYFLEGNVLNI